MTTDFHTLTISRIDPQTDDSVAITFDIPDSLKDSFHHQAGQHLVLKADIGGDEVRRSYSICSPVGADPRIGVKRIANGVFSAWATTSLEPGDTLDVMAPIGEFTLVLAAGSPKRRVAIAAGSGITPVLSMITTALTDEPDSEFTLIYGNRTSQTIMFLDEIEGLKNRFPERFSVVHVLSREPHQVPLFQGRIDGAKMQALLDSLLPADAVDDWYLCGPLDLVETVTATLEAAGVAAGHIHYELFFDQRIEALPQHAPDDEGLAEVAVTLDGRTSLVMVDPAGPSLLDYARSVRADVPFACKGGMCATCKAKVVRGRVTMAKNYALSESQLTDGFVLTCQSHPADDQPVELDYDAR